MNVIPAAHPSQPCSPSSLLRLLHWPSGMGLARGPSGWPSAEGDRVEPAEDLIEPGQRAAAGSSPWGLRRKVGVLGPAAPPLTCSVGRWH